LNTIRDIPERFTAASGSSSDPVWSRDGKQIAFVSVRDNRTAVYTKSTDGTSDEQRLAEVQSGAIPTDFSPDGQFITYSVGEAGSNTQLWLLSVKDRRTSLFREHARSAKFSRDGKWILYSTDASVRNDVYIEAFPEGGKKHQVSPARGNHPRWGKSGEVIFKDDSNRLESVLLRESGQDLIPQTARVIFDRQVQSIADSRSHYDVSSDGQRFLIRQPAAGADSSTLTVIVNWLAALRK
jgi:Tol biopolymer transport system component